MIIHTRLESAHLAGNLLGDPSERLHWGHGLLSHHLTTAGIAHKFTENPGNHGGRANESFQRALAWLSEVLRHEG